MRCEYDDRTAVETDMARRARAGGLTLCCQWRLLDVEMGGAQERTDAAKGAERGGECGPGRGRATSNEHRQRVRPCERS